MLRGGDWPADDGRSWSAHGSTQLTLGLIHSLRKQDEYSILNSKHFIGIHGYMLVYSVSSLPSFEMVQVIRDKILNHLVSWPHPGRACRSAPSHRTLIAG